LYGKDHLTPLKALKLSQGLLAGELSKDVIEKIHKSHDHVTAIVQEEKVVYGINTGFGSLCHTIISKADTRKLQDNLIRSHSVGVGDPVPQSITRLMLILKIHSLFHMSLPKDHWVLPAIWLHLHICFCH
jgi:histidine ammonia-lyase